MWCSVMFGLSADIEVQSRYLGAVVTSAEVHIAVLRVRIHVSWM